MEKSSVDIPVIDNVIFTFENNNISVIFTINFSNFYYRF